MTRPLPLLAVVTLLVVAPAPMSAAAEALVADLGISVTLDGPSADVGDDVALTVEVANAGPDQADEVVVTVSIAKGLVVQDIDGAPCGQGRSFACPIGSLPPGTTLRLELDAAVIERGVQTTSVAVDASGDDPNTSNDSGSVELHANGRSCTIVGSSGADELRAHRHRAVVCGLGDDDVLLGSAWGDTLLGGSGRDALIGEAGRNRLDGGEGVDACTGFPGTGTARGCERGVFAAASKLPLVEIGTTVGYGYHQSLFRTAMPLRPLAGHVVMSSRSRGTGTTTAVDIVVPSHARVRSPVTGTVVAVQRYRLYCDEPDWKVVLQPATEPDLRVLVLHMARPAVADGDSITAGVTLLGRAADNDRSSAQENRYFADRFPHVHIEVERNRASPTPGCAI